MRTTTLLSVILLCACVLMAGYQVQPLNVKPGLWEVTMTTAVSGRPPISQEILAKMTPEQRAKFEASMKGMASGVPKTKTSRNCVTKEQLSKDPFSEEKSNCTRTVLKSTGSMMEIREVCEGEGVKSDVTMRIEALNPENVKGSGHVTAAGGSNSMNVNTSFTAKWLGATCTEKK